MNSFICIHEVFFYVWVDADRAVQVLVDIQGIAHTSVQDITMSSSKKTKIDAGFHTDFKVHGIVS